MLNNETEIYQSLKGMIDSYSSISNESFVGIQNCSKIREIRKNTIFTAAGKIPQSFGYIHSGLMRAYITDEKGNEYNKIFFPERTFPGSMVALLNQSESFFSIETLELTTVVEIDQKAYRRLLFEKEDLKTFHIIYLERNWVIEKEKREVSLIQESATERYIHFCKENPLLKNRIQDYHIASHLGITPTQLSRIKKTLKNG